MSSEGIIRETERARIFMEIEPVRADPRRILKHHGRASGTSRTKRLRTSAPAVAPAYRHAFSDQRDRRDYPPQQAMVQPSVVLSISSARLVPRVPCVLDSGRPRRKAPRRTLTVVGTEGAVARVIRRSRSAFFFTAVYKPCRNHEEEGKKKKSASSRSTASAAPPLFSPRVTPTDPDPTRHFFVRPRDRPNSSGTRALPPGSPSRGSTRPPRRRRRRAPPARTSPSRRTRRRRG